MVIAVRLLHTRYPQFGGHSGIAQLAQYLDRDRFRLTVDPVCDGDHDFPPCPSLLRRALRRAVRARMPWYKLSDLTAEWRAASSCLRGENGIVHFLDGEHSAQFLPSRVLRRALPRVRIVATYHQPEAILGRLVCPAVVRRIDHVTVVSPTQLPFFHRLLPEERVHLILHGVDSDFFRPAAEPLAKLGLRCLTVGHWLRDWDAIGAAARAFLDDPSVRFDLIGPAADGLHLLPNMHVRRGLSDAALAEVYRNADVLLLPLLDATANNALLEGLASGLPVVAYDIPSVRAYAPGAEAIRVPYRDVAGIVEALVHLRDDPERRRHMGHCARRRGEALSWRSQSKYFARLYEAP